MGPKFLRSLVIILSCFYSAKGVWISPEPYNHVNDPGMQEHFDFWNTLKTMPQVAQFKCNTTLRARKDSAPATSVHSLIPSDIGAVGAMGDSITAAFGADARTLLGIFIEFRGKSWSIGGDGSLEEGIITLPNIIKKYNPNVKGFSVGVNLSDRPKEKSSHLNVAVSGAKAKGMLSQAETLVERLASEKLMDEWKLVTMFIGGNDHCQWCDSPLALSPANYTYHIKEALDYLQKHTTKMLVNLVLPLDTTEVRHLNENLLCDVIHRVVECTCAVKPKTYADMNRHAEEVIQYRNGLEDLIGSGRYESREDFTVVIQPFYTNMRVPLIDGHADFSLFAPDCFHYSSKGHADSAQALWNSMFEPTGRKRLSWIENADWRCPTEENPYIYTYKNDVAN